MRQLICVALVILFAVALCGAQTTQPQTAATVHVDTSPQHILNTFDPDTALGAWFDVSSKNAIDGLFTPEGVKAATDWGWGSVTMRNNSELRLAAWHWTENGSWSDAKNNSGYFTGSADLKDPIRYVNSYSLPHRDFATSGDDPLRGGPSSYWKSNPYLTSKFTGESDSLHPQWVVIDMGMPRPVNAIRINWVDPYAVVYVVQYWIGDDNVLDWDYGPNGIWQAFPHGNITDGKGGSVTLKLADKPITARFVRVLMSQSSNTPDTHGADDIRNCVGYAMQSVDVGSIDDAGAYTQAYPITQPASRPARDNAFPGSRDDVKGSFCVSSIDVWHAADNLAEKNGYTHVGMDLFFTSGLTNSNPALIPVTMLYGTPDDAANEVAYVKARGYPVVGIEMGEEPDGKHVMPEDEAALYIQFATAIHKLVPDAKLGGPIFEGVNKDITLWADANGHTSWLGRFISYLKDHGHLDDLAFMSFEHYPFLQNHGPPPEVWDTLYAEPGLMKNIMQTWRADGVPANVPLIVSESGMDAGGGNGMERRVEGAIWECDAIGSFLEQGGAAFYRNNIRGGRPRATTNPSYSSSYWADHMLNKQWLQHRAGKHEMFPASCDLRDSAGHVVITSYAVHRPDGNWSLMLINRDQNNPHSLHIVFDDADQKQKSFTGQVDIVTFGFDQFQIPAGSGRGARPDPDGPPKSSMIDGATIELPKASVTVVRGKIE